MLITKLKRTLRSGFISFWRNGSVSLASVLVMTITLIVISCVLFVGVVLNTTLKDIQSKVDINVYFTKDAVQDGVDQIVKSVKALPQVADITYTNKEDSLKEFRLRHQNDQLTLQALDELGDNPLGAKMSVRAKDPSQYETIVKFIKNSGGDNGTVDRINYDENKVAIDKLAEIIVASRKLGFAAVLFFIFVSVLITFNTIRLAIFIFREEISVMQLVGASAMYIRGPFVTSGVMYGICSGLLTMLVLWPISYWLGLLSDTLGVTVNLYQYYQENWFQLAFLLIISGLILGATSSYLAVKRYLRI
ncbi:MAG: permease-like cell division protein FtsX [bacterium]